MCLSRLVRTIPCSCRILFVLAVIANTGNVFAETPQTVSDLVSAVGVPGGLCVQVGGDDLGLAISLAKTGRFLVQVLDQDARTVEQARRQLRSQGLYGLVSVDRWTEENKLPYTENLINVLILLDKPAWRLPKTELQRVVCPNGVVLSTATKAASAAKKAGFVDVRSFRLAKTWIAEKKPWPDGMDEWTHPRHSASGNAVSADLFVGPPRRVRWVVAAQAEVRGIVSSGGRNFYAAALARDAFNGLRLWNRDLVQPSSHGRFAMKNFSKGMPPPVVTDKYLFAVTGGKLLALNATSGATVREYAQAGHSRELLQDDGVLIAVDAGTVRAFDVETGRLLWAYSAAEPRDVVSGDQYVALIQGRPTRGEKAALVMLDKSTGKRRWIRDDFPWTAKVMRCVYSHGVLAYEVSTFNNNGPGNAIHVLSADSGELYWDREYPPGMNHIRQARALFVGDRLWILRGGQVDDKTHLPIQCSALDPQSGDVLKTLNAGLTHCFPPVATPRYLLAGEMNFTDFATGRVDAHHITKAACSRDFGWMPANGLVYVTPKHCVCWPMLRGYAALAPEEPGQSVAKRKLDDMDFVLEKGVDPPTDRKPDSKTDWPVYRHDAWRSGSVTTTAPSETKAVWSVDLGDLGDLPGDGPIIDDWRENPFVKGPITAPVIADGRVLVARPDVHEVVALDAQTGDISWRFTANGRVDTAPTIYHGLCLFGTKTGFVYCLRATDGKMVWRLRAAPDDERIVAYGQVESPWPVPGSVLVVDDTAYFAAGRQPLADGGIFLFAVDPFSGATRWVQRLDSVPQKGFYESSALEFDNFDLLYRKGGGVAMSRWMFDRKTGAMSVDRWSAFAKLNTGSGAALVPPGFWSYAPRHEPRIGSYTPRRPLVVFHDNVLFGCLQGSRSLFRRDFHLEDGEKINTHWMTGWEASKVSRDGKMPWPNNRLAEKAAWQVDVFDAKTHNQTIDAILLAGDRLFCAGSGGELQVRATADGRLLATQKIPQPLWDGLAAAEGRLFLATADGQLVCLGSQRR